MVVVFELAAGDGFGVGIGTAEEVVGELGQLAGAVEGLGVDHEGREDFGVAVFAGVQVEHEADESALKTGSGAHVDGKARAAELGRPLQIENPQRLAQLPVRPGLKVKDRLFAPSFDGKIIGLGFTRRHFVAGKVGNTRQDSTHPLVINIGIILRTFKKILFEADFLRQSRCVLAGLLEFAHLLAQ